MCITFCDVDISDSSGVGYVDVYQMLKLEAISSCFVQ